jgi:hypothetical protein
VDSTFWVVSMTVSSNPATCPPGSTTGLKEKEK